MATKREDPVNKIYFKLKDTLIKGYVGENPRARSYITWKLTIPPYIEGIFLPENTVREDFNILEAEGVVSIDKFDKIKEIFREIHAEAVREIDKASRKIQEAKSRQSTENTDDSYSVFAAEILIQVPNESQDLQKT